MDLKQILADKDLAQKIKEVFDLHKQDNEVLVLVQTNKKPEIYLPAFDKVIAKHTQSGGGNLIKVTRDMVDKLPIDFVKTENVLQGDEFSLPKVVEETEKVGDDFNLPKVGEATNEVRTKVGEIVINGKEQIVDFSTEILANDKGKKQSFSAKF